MVIVAPCLMSLLTQVVLMLLILPAVPILQRSADILVDYICRFHRHTACQGNMNLDLDDRVNNCIHNKI